MPAAEQFLWFNRTMSICGKWIAGIVRKRACFPIRLLEIILISSGEQAEHTWYIVDPQLGNVTFFVTWWCREIYQLCINLLTTTDFTMSRQIAVGENWPSMCTETHIFKQTNCYSKILKSFVYICWEHEIQTDDADGISSMIQLWCKMFVQIHWYDIYILLAPVLNTKVQSVPHTL